jgi:hypothetical protein
VPLGCAGLILFAACTTSRVLVSPYDGCTRRLIRNAAGTTVAIAHSWCVSLGRPPRAELVLILALLLFLLLFRGVLDGLT